MAAQDFNFLLATDSYKVREAVESFSFFWRFYYFRLNLVTFSLFWDEFVKHSVKFLTNRCNRRQWHVLIVIQRCYNNGQRVIVLSLS